MLTTRLYNVLFLLIFFKEKNWYISAKKFGIGNYLKIKLLLNEVWNDKFKLDSCIKPIIKPIIFLSIAQNAFGGRTVVEM